MTKNGKLVLQKGGSKTFLENKQLADYVWCIYATNPELKYFVCRKIKDI